MSNTRTTRRDPEEEVVTYTDKRKINAAGEAKMPTAEALLSEAQPVSMTDEEKEALLARQAAELEGIPYEGAGLEVDAKPEPRKFLTAYTVLVPFDGPPECVAANIVVSDETGEPEYTIDRDPVNRDLYLACTEIARSITLAEQAQIVVMANMSAAAGMAREQTAHKTAADAISRATRKKH